MSATTIKFPTPAALLDTETAPRIAVAGAGGTGCQFLDGLAALDASLRARGMAGFDVTVMDPDSVSAANIGRQRFRHGDEGLPKASLLVHRLNGFRNLDWKAKVGKMSIHEAGRFDLVVTCVDLGRFRRDLGEHWHTQRSEALWLDTGNGASRGQCVLGHLGKTLGDRLPNIYDLYGDDLLAGDADDFPSCSLEEALTRQRFPVNRIVAECAITLLDQLVHRGGLVEHGAIFQLDPLRVSPLAIDEKAWAFFGYKPPRTKKKKKA